MEFFGQNLTFRIVCDNRWKENNEYFLHILKAYKNRESPTFREGA